MHSDHYYEIGTTHVACEDYAISGTEEGMSYAILSDGCSSSKDTDVGARILCHIAKNALLYLNQQGVLKDDHYLEEMFPQVFRSLVVMKALEARQSLGLSYNAFDATLLAALAVERPGQDPSWAYIVFGDGVVVERYCGGDKARIIRVSFESNAPYYLSYAMNKEKNESYIWSFGGKKRVNTLIDAYPDSFIEYDSEEYKSDPMSDFSAFMSCDLVMNTPLQIALFSDGVGSVERKDGSVAMSDVEAACRCTAYKNTAGEFVHRRMKAFSKQCTADGLGHFDDLSCAAIHIGGPRRD
jgi:hypothetical protein